jgi:hypothetical protein
VTNLYFEFFAKPHDIHINPNQQKGVILDTNSTYNKECVWDMLKKKRASAYGGQAYFCSLLKKGGTSFSFLINITELFAAGEVLTDAKEEYNKGLKG